MTIHEDPAFQECVAHPLRRLADGRLFRFHDLAGNTFAFFIENGVESSEMKGLTWTEIKESVRANHA